MYYAAIDLLAILVLVLENLNILIDRNKSFEETTWKVYRRFLFAVLAYYIIDGSWGIIEYYKLPLALFAVTTVYFAVMAMGIVLWTAGVFFFLHAKGRFVRGLKQTGLVVATALTASAVLNIFVPVLFTVDSACVYEALPLRYIFLGLQIAILVAVSGYCFALYVRNREQETEGHQRYRTVVLFGLIMALFLTIQLWFPYLPLYAIAYMLGTCLVKAYVIDDEKEKYRQEVKESLKVVELKNTITSLIDNMPGLTFTKEPETSMFLACNQAFAEYAGKNSPEEVIGLTDADLFDEEMAKRYGEDDMMVMSMDEPYVFIEDITDAEGNKRQFQTTKYKYTDIFGRVCILGMANEMMDIAQVRREFASTKEEYEKAKETAIVYNHIAQALSYGYDELFYVYLDTEDYVNYGTDDNGMIYEKRRGTDFFPECQIEVNTLVCEEDRDMFRKVIERETLLGQINAKKAFEITYRVPKGENGDPFFVRMRATIAPDDDNILIIGINDADEEMKAVRAQELLREADLARRLSAAQRQANIDSMTGVRNKRAYLEAEERLEFTVKETEDPKFAISIIDINDLKYINDEFGHQAGDQYIREACRVVCTTFKRSPVFRVGGDEFCVISQGDDYENIKVLLQKIEDHNTEALNNGGVVIACGTAFNNKGESVSDVYKRADKIMYENKVRLKKGRGVR
ncbi:MAG: diguanylate cyclase [Clostridiales bacterium]|nr:diguanylate cyclase [Clostridiales bacterium]